MRAIILAILASLLTACASTRPVTDQVHSAVTGAATVRDLGLLLQMLK